MKGTRQAGEKQEQRGGSNSTRLLKQSAANQRLQTAPEPTNSTCRCDLRGHVPLLCNTTWQPEARRFQKRNPTCHSSEKPDALPALFIFPAGSHPRGFGEGSATSTSPRIAFQPRPLPSLIADPPTCEISAPLQIEPSVQKGGARRELDEGRRGPWGSPTGAM